MCRRSRPRWKRHGSYLNAIAWSAVRGARPRPPLSEQNDTDAPAGWRVPYGMHVSPKSETVELLANDAWLVLAPPELDRVISWHHSINEAMGRLVRLIDQVVVETNRPSQGSRPSRSDSIAATEPGRCSSWVKVKKPDWARC